MRADEIVTTGSAVSRAAATAAMNFPADLSKCERAQAHGCRFPFKVETGIVKTNYWYSSSEAFGTWMRSARALWFTIVKASHYNRMHSGKRLRAQRARRAEETIFGNFITRERVNDDTATTAGITFQWNLNEYTIAINDASRARAQRINHSNAEADPREMSERKRATEETENDVVINIQYN